MPSGPTFLALQISSSPLVSATLISFHCSVCFLSITFCSLPCTSCLNSYFSFCFLPCLLMCCPFPPCSATCYTQRVFTPLVGHMPQVGHPWIRRSHLVSLAQCNWQHVYNSAERNLFQENQKVKLPFEVDKTAVVMISSHVSSQKD